tara:strand:- start:2187 stop:3662 length:1476 start_codon:yes stop_codon:yes gene_type:complete
MAIIQNQLMPTDASQIDKSNKSGEDLANLGSSKTNIKTLDPSLGALAPFIDQASGILDNIYGKTKLPTQEEKDLNMGRLALKFFTTLGAQSSVPGSTLLGAANVAGAQVAQDYLNKIQSDKDKADKLAQAKKSGALTLGMQLMTQGNKVKDQKAYKFTKPIKIGKVSYDKDSVEYFTQKAFNELPSEIKRLLVPYSDPVVKDPAIGKNAFGEDIYITGDNKGSRVYSDTGSFINYDKKNVAEEKDEVKTVIEKEEPTEKAPPRRLNLKEQDAYGKLSGAYGKSPDVKKYEELKGNANKVVTNYNMAYQLERPQAADLAMIFAFMKMLDPRSVVRESEQDQARATGGAADWLITYVTSLQGGGSLTDAQRTSFRNLAMEYYAKSTQDLETYNKKELTKAPLYNFETNILETYLVKPKQFDISGYMVRLPKINFEGTDKERLEEFDTFVKKNKLKASDIYYLRKAKNYKASPNREKFDSLITAYINKLKGKKP